MVPHGELYCNGCGHQPPTSVSCPASKPAKGGGKGTPGTASGAKAKAQGDGCQRAAEWKAAERDKENAALKAKLDKLAAASAAERKSFQSQLDALKAGQASSGSDGDVAMAADGPEEAKRAADQVKAAEKWLSFIQGLEAEHRGAVCDHRGGYEAVLAAALESRDAAHAERRGLKDLKSQKASAEGHLQKVENQVALAKTKGGALQQKLSLLLDELVAHEQEEKRLAATLAKAKRDVVSLTDRLTAELRQEDGSQAPAVAEATPSAFAPGSTLWQSVGKLTQFAENAAVIHALQEAGLAQGEFQELAKSVAAVNAVATASLAVGQAAGALATASPAAVPPATVLNGASTQLAPAPAQASQPGALAAEAKWVAELNAEQHAILATSDWQRKQQDGRGEDRRSGPADSTPAKQARTE